MAFRMRDRIKQLSTTQGVGSYTLGTIPAGFRGFADPGVMSINDTTVVVARGASAFEVAEVQLVNSTTLSRTTILANSLGTTEPIDWPDNSEKEIFMDPSAAYLVLLNVENIWLADQLMRLRKLKFGTSDLSSIAGTDTELQMKAGSGLEAYFKSNGEVLLWTNYDGATAPGDLALMVNSGSPSVNDVLKAVAFRGKNSAGSAVTYGKLYCRIKDATAGEEDAEFIFQVMKNGVLTSFIVADGSTGDLRWKTGWNVVDEV